jgi:hypothetical protein
VKRRLEAPVDVAQVSRDLNQDFRSLEPAADAVYAAVAKRPAVPPMTWDREQRER